jgi:hypothetical protein
MVKNNSFNLPPGQQNLNTRQKTDMHKVRGYTSPVQLPDRCTWSPVLDAFWTKTGQAYFCFCKMMAKMCACMALSSFNLENLLLKELKEKR